MVKLFTSQKLSLKKISFFKGKSLFVVLPIALLFGALVFAASQAKNITTVAHNAIFSPIQSQNEIIELTKNTSNKRFIDILNSDSSNTGYTATDVSNVSTINNVEKANLVTSLPIDNMKSLDLFEGKSFTIDTIAGLEETYASLYTNGSFSYSEGQPIPIILNANDFVEVYEDWGGKDSIEINFATNTEPNPTQIQGPIKARAISYNRDELIGKTFTITFGGLGEIQTYKTENTSSGFKYVKKTEKEIATELTTRKNSISKYWDYTKISTPITYTFVVAGISEGTDKTTAYIPAGFASRLMNQYLSNEIAARNKKSMPSTDYNVTYVGLVYDGVTLQEDQTTSLFAGIRNSVTDQVKNQFNDVNKQIASQNSRINSTNAQIDRAKRVFVNGAPPQGGKTGAGGNVVIDKIGKIGSLDAGNIKINFPGAATSYSIPGLVFKKDRATNNLTGEYNKFAAETSLPLPSTSMLIKLTSIGEREQVVKELNSKGYNYVDFSKYKQYETLEKYMNMILLIASGVIVVITGLFVLINMAKFVSEGRKEIGIFRAIGATKADIRRLFLQQAVAYILIAIILGIGLGSSAVLLLANTMVTTAQTFISSTLGSSLILTGKMTAADFTGFDIARIGIYSGGLVLITLLVSVIPASQAARVSPVEAIRNS